VAVILSIRYYLQFTVTKYYKQYNQKTNTELISMSVELQFLSCFLNPVCSIFFSLCHIQILFEIDQWLTVTAPGLRQTVPNCRSTDRKPQCSVDVCTKVRGCIQLMQTITIDNPEHFSPGCRAPADVAEL